MDPIRLDAPDTSLLLACAIGAPPRILHWGAALPAGASGQDLASLDARFAGPGGADVVIGDSLALEPGLGLLGPDGFSAHREGRDWGSLFAVRAVERREGGAFVRCHDARTRLNLDYDIALDPRTGVLTVSSTLTNAGEVTLDLVDMATACLPIPAWCDDIIGFSGRWTDEFRRERLARFTGGYVRENRRGRTGHDSFPAVILCPRATTETAGEAFGLHLAWSGNHRIRVDTLMDGRVFASLGALLWPGEVRLAPGESHASPAIVASYSPRGFNGLSQNFHRHVRERLLRPSNTGRPRPVHYNTWEAVYFDHDVDKLKGIADRAAAIGVERFVLDDGWFGARRHDRAGLGDWTVAREVYPHGLKPLIDHVRGLGMEMGLWFEPEMVNPDSDLYRTHPDWTLRIEGVDQVPYRHQVVLDISRPEVSDYLFGQIDAILTEYDIAYIKWDMNRDLNHPGDALGRPRAFAQVGALYALLDRIRAAHPRVEIESCSSGGARPDMGVLAHTDRIWTSDSNDAIDRQGIQRGASYFLPLNVLGAHAGPGRCHQTGRRLSMAMRAGTALMGHMGMELNLLTEPERDLDVLKSAVSLYKAHRGLLHSGDFHRLDAPDFLNGVGVVSEMSDEALFSIAWLRGHAATLPGRVRLTGLDPAKAYRVKLVWPQPLRPYSGPAGAKAFYLTDDAAPVSGELLMRLGLELPLVGPESVVLFHLRAA